MKIKNVLLSCMLLGALTASAQDEPQTKTEYVPNPYWYIQVQGGAQYTLGEIKFGDLLSPNVQVAVGRQFNPVFGMRLAVNAWQSRAGIEFDRYVYPTGAVAEAGTAKWKWMYVAPGIDLTFNLSNLFCGFNPNRLFNFSVFIGGGVNIGWDFDKSKNVDDAHLLLDHYRFSGGQNLEYAWTGTKVRGFGRAGIAGDFRLSDAVSLGLEVNANTLSDRYNGKKAGNWDWYFNALAGVKINLGKTYTTRTIEIKPQERIIEKTIERVIEKPCPQQTTQPATAQIAEKKKETFRRDVFFTINSTNPNKEQMNKVKEVAEYLQKHPNAKVEVTGYADVGTGNPKINLSLSQRRAQTVTKLLVNQYKIAASRIKTDWKGDTIQPFAVEVENRVAICIAE